MEGTVDSSGRIAIPKALRDRLGLAPGSRVRLVADGDRLSVQAASEATLTWDADGLPTIHTELPEGGDFATLVEVDRAARSDEVVAWPVP